MYLFPNLSLVKIYRLFLKSLFFICLCFFYHSSKASETIEKSILREHIENIHSLISMADYDSAYTEVSQILPIAIKTNYTEEKYYLHILESEILYYKSLFNPALNSSYRALALAKTLDNDTLTGSIQNLIGLALTNMGQYKEAEKQLRSSILKLPFNHGKPMLAQRFHAASNLSEVFLHENMTDSALHYARFSLREAELMKNYRAIAINYWNISKAHQLNGQPDSALYYLEIGKPIAIRHRHTDIQMFFTSLEADVFISKGLIKQGLKEIRTGMKRIASGESLSDYSKIDFLEEAVGLAFKAHDYVLAAELQVMLNQLKEVTDGKRNAEQLKLMEIFYANERQLEVSEAEKVRYAIESRLNRKAFVLTVIAVIFLLIAAGLLLYLYIQKHRHVNLEQENQKKLLTLQKEKEKVEELAKVSDAERNRIAKELHDDIGGSLNSLTLYSEVALKSISENPQKSQELLEKINLKSKVLSENISDIIWAVYSKNDTLNNVIMRMKNFAFEMITPLDIKIDFHYPYQIDQLAFNSEQRKNIYYIFREAVNNAVKHSNCTCIHILIEEIAPQTIRMSISDNGNGFDITTIKKNNGFYTMQSRAKAINGNTSIQSDATGTVISVEFPLKYYAS